MEKLVLIIGGNLGDRLLLIQRARIMLSEKLGDELLASSIFETEAWGGKSTGNYLNQVLIFESQLEPFQVLSIIQGIEQQLERVREVKWGDRTMDIDILYYGERILDAEKLIIPHPFLEQRRFVLEPLAEVMPEFIHPVLGKTQAELLAKCTDHSKVRTYEKSPEYPGH
ncbi:MAG: 2-amino-4-hydroxy-6-hydroxymethyldihydropteridine diphosphokinase [Cecembia sp.]